MSKRRAVFLSATDPAQQGSGDASYSASVLNLIRATGLFDDVTVVLTRSATTRLPQTLQRAHALGRALTSPLPIKFHTSVDSTRLSSLIDDLHRNPAALVILNHSELLGLLCRLPAQVPKIVVSHNLEHQLWAERAANDPQFPAWLKPLMVWDSKKFFPLETDAARKVRNVWSISQEDSNYFRSLGPDMNVVSIPPTFRGSDDVPAVAPLRRDQPIRLGFLGQLSWWPNAEGADWLVRDVIPFVDSRAVEWHFFGGGTQRLDKVAPNVIGHGFVPSIDAVWAGIDVMVCPIFSGGGVNVKFGEAVFNGKPVIATSFAGRGLAKISDPAIRFLDDPHSWKSLIGGAGLAQLAARTPTAKSRGLFTEHTYVTVVADFVQRVFERSGFTEAGA